MNWTDFDQAKSIFLTSPDEDGLKIHLRSYVEDAHKTPLLFVHGATYGSRMYDIPAAGMSWLRHASQAGFPSYAIDIRGYGKSRSNILFETEKPYATAHHAIKDIDLAVNWLCETHSVDQVNLLGGSWGSITSSLYTSTIGKDRVRALALYAPIFSATNSLWQKLLAASDNPDHYNTELGNYRTVDWHETQKRWDEEIPEGEVWRDDRVLDALVQSSISDFSSNASADHFIVPNGTLLDLWQVFGRGNALYDPKLIECPVLLLRGSGDLSSTREDAFNLFELLGTNDKQYVEIAGGGHFISAERRAPAVFAAADQFFTT